MLLVAYENGSKNAASWAVSLKMLRAIWASGHIYLLGHALPFSDLRLYLVHFI
jgi:hypothetical protein